MKSKLCWKVISMLLVIATLVTALPLTIFAGEASGESSADGELYIKSVRLAQAKTKSEAKASLEADGYIFLDGNLNDGTGEDGIWLGYTVTTDPTEAIYDMKVMNMNGGFTLTSVKKALAAQESAFQQMTTDLTYLIDEFVEAYEEESVPAEKAYMALNFFRVVDGESELIEKNGLGYQFVHGGFTHSMLTEMIMLCDSEIVDSVIKILTMGIQVRNKNWMQSLSEIGPYDDDTDYGELETEYKRRADQLAEVIRIYAEAYDAMDRSGLIPDKLNDNLEPENTSDKKQEILTAEDAEIKKLDESRYKIYKIVFDELDEYKYGTDGKTLKDFFLSFVDGGNSRELFPLVSVLSDAEYAAMSYGCFLEVASGATATYSDFDSYDDIFASATEEVKSLYLYAGVDKALLSEDSVIGFTDTASRHMALTGELEFYENERTSEYIWETGKQVAKVVAAVGLATMAVAKLTIVATSIAGAISSVAATSIESGMLAGVMKVATMISGGYAFLIAAAAVALTVLAAFIISSIVESINDSIDWDDNPMPKYLYDVKEVTFSQSSVNDGIVTESIKRPVFKFYEAVCDATGNVVDLNARSGDSTQWIAMYVSRDKEGDDAKPIKADELLVRTGNGEVPVDYTPLTRFGEVVAYDLNQWDEDDAVNGVYFFYKQDKAIAVDSGETYYVYDVYLQTGESDSHCIGLLEAAGYTPINMNLTPNLTDADIVFKDNVYTYLGYKVTTNPNSAIRDIRIGYGPSLGEVKFGAATYADCGSNGTVTLYATKYKSMGTPILAGGLIAVNNRWDAPRGYEPVNSFAGGDAASLNVTLKGLNPTHKEYFLYFLPETTFTSGNSYLGGVSYIQHNLESITSPMHFDGANLVLEYLKNHTGFDYQADTVEQKRTAMRDYLLYKMGYDRSYIISEEGSTLDMVLYYQTYNPYRAIYEVRATEMKDVADTLMFESIGYTSFGAINWGTTTSNATHIGHLLIAYSFRYNANANLNGTLYLAGNPSTANLHKANGNAMNGAQPIRISRFLCEANAGTQSFIASTMEPVTDLFSNTGKPAEFKNSKAKYSFSFYVAEKGEDRPYVSGITAVDMLTLYREYHTTNSKISRDDITDSMLIAQLANQGATNFCDERIQMISAEGSDYGFMNTMKFGYMRSASSDNALTDVFMYFNKFSADEAPSELYRGEVKYTLLCEIPYNLTGYKDAPKPGVYLYGTTDVRAGERIIDFTVSKTPFMDGYETIRTMNGRSLVGEIYDYMVEAEESHFLSGARKVYDTLVEFFETGSHQNALYYLHVKREGDDIRAQKPYIGEIYLASYPFASFKYSYDLRTGLDKLFDLGAEGYVNVDLNEGAGGSYVILGYSYTADPEDAIKEIRAYHKKNPPSSLTDEYGKTFTLVQDFDLNKNAGGDYIYLYATKESKTAQPIIDIDAIYNVKLVAQSHTFVDGSDTTTLSTCVKMWNSSSYSDLNEDAGGKYIYLYTTTVKSTYKGTYKEPYYGKDKTYTRDGYDKVSANGKYIGGLYVMDKLTIREEKLAAGVPSADCTLDKITDREVFDRLLKMGAAEIIKTPIQVSGTSYFKNNENKAFIGYSRTDKLNKAIKNIAFKAEILSLSEPEEKIEIDKKTYKLVAEAAKKVTELPKAINLLAVEGGEDMLLPRLYLYYSTSGSEPIYDVSIDAVPLVNGQITAKSANGLDPFADIYYLAREQYDLADQDDKDSYDYDIVYTDQMLDFMDDVSAIFNPKYAKAKPFYIHYKNYTEDSLEEIKPYIGEIFIAKGYSRHEALSQLVKFTPDGYIDVNLNKNAGGDAVYLAYRRVESASEALTDIAIYEGSDPALIRRITVGEASIKYSLAADVDINSKAGGKYLYVYTADSQKTGNPITNLSVESSVISYLKCGVEKTTVKRADGTAFTDEYINLNKKAGGNTLYLVMQRETDGGHTKGEVISDILIEANCGAEGSHTVITKCLDCTAEIKEVEIFSTVGEHFDASDDGDHDCDVCGLGGITDHIEGDVERESVILPTEYYEGEYLNVCRCTECNEVMREELVVLAIGSDISGIASVFGTGSLTAICALAGIAILSVIVIIFQKQTKQKESDEE